MSISHQLTFNLDKSTGQYVDPSGRHASLSALSGACDQLTVEAWLQTDVPAHEGLACAVSAWSLREDMKGFRAFDAQGTDGLDIGGFLGAVFDGRYVYFVPQHDSKTRSGKVLRYDTHKPFDDPAAYVGYDASATAGMDTRGYYGAIFDGRYVYFTPRTTENGLHTRVLRYDTKVPFTDEAAWDAHDAGMTASYQGVAFDGRFIYFAPGYVQKDQIEDNSTILRLDTEGDFHDTSSWATYDAGGTDGLLTENFDGGAFDGRYIYFIPLLNGAVLQLDTHGDFSAPSSWAAYDVAPLGVACCVGSVYDGRYLYLVPYGTTKVVVRFDTTASFKDADAWTAFDAGHVGGLRTVGYDGGAFDGRYVYFIPFWDEKGYFHCNFLRYDTSEPFDDVNAWSSVDAAATDGFKTIGYNAGAFDGRYLYCAPWHDGSTYLDGAQIVGHCRILRYDTVGPGAAFSLRWCDYGHNGGLNAALPGPTFVINTDRGPRSVSAHRSFPAGEHHMVGAYDGRMLRLYVDGECVASCEADGNVTLGAAAMAIGRLTPDGGGALGGRVTQVRISAGSDPAQTATPNGAPASARR